MERAENINPAILSWARESAGLSIDEAADRLGLSSNASVTAAEKLAEFEQGDRFPTRIQLLRILGCVPSPSNYLLYETPAGKGRARRGFSNVFRRGVDTR